MTGTIATVNGGKQVERKLNVRRDTLDFRDRMFEATLIEVPTHIPLSAWRKWRVPVLDQGKEGPAPALAWPPSPTICFHAARSFPTANR